MVDKRIVVPAGMLEAALEAYADIDTCRVLAVTYLVLLAALRWQDEKLNGMKSHDHGSDYDSAIEDVRRMFLAPDL